MTQDVSTQQLHNTDFSFVPVPAPITQLVECPLRGTGGHGFDPGPRHTKVVKNGTTLFARSFRRRFFAYHYAMNHPHTNIILSSFSSKMCRKTFENRFTNKNLMSKNVFE